MKRQFKLVPHSDQEATSHVLPVVRIVGSDLYLDGTLEERTCIEHVSSTKVYWTRCVEGGNFEHGLLILSHNELCGHGVVVFSEDAHQTAISSSTKKLTFHASNQSYAEDVSDSYNMQYSSDVWASHTPTPSMTNPVSFGSLAFDTITVGGDTGLGIPVVTVQILDELCNAINQSLASSGQPEVESLYTSAVNLGEEETSQSAESTSPSIVTFTGAAFVASIADQPVGTLENLTFKNNLNSPLVLPLLFQQMYLIKQNDNLTGSIYELSPSMRGLLGNRHYFSSYSNTTETVQTRSQKSKPAPITQKLGDFAELSVEDLMLIAGYNDPAVHHKTQHMIRMAMLYWMEPSIRENVLQAAQPGTDIRTLTDQLDPNIGSWLQNIYGPAYVSNVLCYIDPNQTTSWRKQITEAQQAQLQYWWSGWGPNCLSQSAEYNTLSGTAFFEAMLDLYPRLRYYLSNPTLWAQRLDFVLKNRQCMLSLQNTPFSGATNYANKLTNMLRVFDVEGQYGNDLVNTFLANSIAQLLQSSYINDDPTKIQSRATWLGDAFTSLATAVFSPINSDPGQGIVMNGEVQTGLAADLATIEQALHLDSSLSASDRARNLSQALPADLMPVYSTEMSSNGADAAGVPQINWKTRYSKLFVSISNTLAKLFAPGSEIVLALRGSLAVIGMGALIYDAYAAFSKWSDATPAQKALMVFNTLSGALGVAGKVWKCWLVYNQKVPQSTTLETEAAAHQLDEATSSELQDMTDSLGDGLSNLDPETKMPLAERVSAQINQGETPPGPVAGPAEVENNEPITELPTTGSTALEDACAAFATTQNAISAVWTVMNIAVVITCSIDLAQNWNSYNNVGKAFHILSITVSAISILATQFVAQAFNVVAAWLEIDYVVSANLMSMLPGIGFGVAMVGVVFAVLLTFLNTSAPPPAPSTPPTQSFVQNDMPSLLAQLQDQPDSLLKYDVPSSVTAGELTTFQITADNATGSAVQLDNVTFTLRTGTETACAFTTMSFSVTDTSDRLRGDDGKAYLDQTDTCRLILSPTRYDAGAMQFDFKVTGTQQSSAQYATDDSPTPLILERGGAGQPAASDIYGSGFRLNISATGAAGTDWTLQIIEGLLQPTRDSAITIIGVSKQ